MSAWQGWSAGGSRVSPEASFRWRAECERAGGDCAARVEAVALRMPDARAYREGTQLNVFTIGGIITLDDRREPGTCRYRYLGMLASGEHLVWRRDLVGECFMTVHCESADATLFADLASALRGPARRTENLRGRALA
jgi:hypothetical protein